MIINTAYVLEACLVLHLTGLVLMAGMSVADIIAYNNFWKQYALNKQKALDLFTSAATFQKVLAIGAVLLLLTGVGMMALTHGIFGEQLWMKVKIGIVVLIIINGPVLGRVQGIKLKTLLLANTAEQKIMMMKRRIGVMSVLNLLFLACIVILSIFKFN